MNQKFDFKTKNEFVEFLSNKFNIEKKSFLFVDSLSLLSFANTLTGAVYYGSFINATCQIPKSEFLKNNETCIGRIEKEFSVILNNYVPSNCDSSIILTDYKFRFLQNPEMLFEFSGNERVSIFIIYNHQFGSYYDDLYKEIINTHSKRKDKFNLYVISLDDVYHLK